MPSTHEATARVLINVFRTTRYGLLILDGEYQGIMFASDEPHLTPGDVLRVRFCPDDQFAFPITLTPERG